MRSSTIRSAFICFAVSSAETNGTLGNLDPEMGNGMKANRGIKTLLEIYRNLFRIPENTNHYSDRDYRAAERKFLKYALTKRRMKLEEESSGE